MNTIYNNTLDDTVSTNPALSRADVDYMVRNRFNELPMYGTLYIANSLVRHANFPGIVSYAYGKGLKLGIAYSSDGEIDNMLNYNKVQTVDKKLYFAVTEIEPYNTGDYAGMTARMQYAYPKLKAMGLRHLVYMGWPTDSYWATIVANCDEINLHCYLPTTRMTASGIWGYVKGRLALIAAAAKAQNKFMPVNIIYSCEPAFAYDWFKKKNWYDAHALFLSQYNQLASTVMKQQLDVRGMSVFVSKYMKQVKP